MEAHIRIATYSMKQGSVQETAELAKAGMLPIFKAQPGFVRYSLAELDDGNIASVSIWETHDEAEAANAAAAEWVAGNLAERIALETNHIGDFLFDEGV